MKKLKEQLKEVTSEKRQSATELKQLDHKYGALKNKFKKWMTQNQDKDITREYTAKGGHKKISPEFADDASVGLNSPKS